MKQSEDSSDFDESKAEEIALRLLDLLTECKKHNFNTYSIVCDCDDNVIGFQAGIKEKLEITENPNIICMDMTDEDLEEE